jgi:hypothetical protein
VAIGASVVIDTHGFCDIDHADGGVMNREIHWQLPA